VTADELQDDPLLGAVACWQQQQLHQQWRDTGSGQHPHGAPDGAQPAATQQQQEEEEEEVVVTLDGIACSHLLAAHPDPGLRRQVYQEAVEPGGLAVLRVLDDLAAVRAKIAR
jgi:Zn-dependent oligopeptidase